MLNNSIITQYDLEVAARFVIQYFIYDATLIEHDPRDSIEELS